MFAVIESGGKQYRVEPGDVLDVELVALGPSDAEQAPGSITVKFERVLALGGDGETAPSFGAPVVEGALVIASLVGESRGPKLRVFKTKRRNTQRRTRGHRQHLHRVRIDEIQPPSSGKPAASAAPAAAAPPVGIAAQEAKE
jgi:large subunit ribosomal protein L21